LSKLDEKFPADVPLLVTCGLPYANGPCHIAHLRTYVPGDVFVRYMRKLGRKVVFVCGSDAHGTPITVNAQKLGIHPRELVEKYHRHFQEVFKRLRIKFDNYGNTDDPINHRRTVEIVKRLIENGLIYEKEVELPYCPHCGRFLPDRYVKGICPHCGAEARGDECDQGCGAFLEPGELIDPRCAVCGSKPVMKRTKHYFFRLTAFRDFLLDFLSKLEGTKPAIRYSIEWVKGGLKDWCITRNLEWGVKFPGEENLVLYCWVDAPIGYISSTEEWSQKTGGDWKAFWMRGEGRIIHFIGSDIVYHHCIFWPSILKGAEYSLPWAVVASGMVKVEGRVFSKSRGYVVWVEEDYLDRGLDVDCLRYYLVSYTSHTRDLDFSWRVYMNKVNKELVGNLGNFFYRALLFTHRYFKTIPGGEVEEEVYGKIKETYETIVDSLTEFEFKRASDSIMALASFGNRYFQSKQPWSLVKQDRESCGHVMYNCLRIVKALTIFMEPIMPGKAEEAWRQLNQSKRLSEVGLEEALEDLEVGRPLPKPKPLFRKVSQDLVDELTSVVKERVRRASGGG